MESSPSQQHEIDIIRKPRTTYSSNVLRRAVPNINLQQKKESITMVKLKVLTALKLPKDGQQSRRVKTVEQLPKILSIISPQQKYHDNDDKAK
jgi:hypothetical protein